MARNWSDRLAMRESIVAWRPAKRDQDQAGQRENDATSKPVLRASHRESGVYQEQQSDIQQSLVHEDVETGTQLGCCVRGAPVCSGAAFATKRVRQTETVCLDVLPMRIAVRSVPRNSLGHRWRGGNRVAQGCGLGRYRG